MPSKLISTALGLALASFVAAPVAAVPLTPPTNANGTFDFDNDVEQFDFSINAQSIVTIETISYAGGTLATNQSIVDLGGGFDPIISLFDGTGAFIAEADDGSATVDPVSGNAFDSFLEEILPAGSYTVVVTQFDNFFLGDVGDDISVGFGIDGLLPGDDPQFFTALFGCSNGSFCDISGNNRTDFFNVNVSAQAVPEPSAIALLGFGLIGAGLAHRRCQRG